jgi:hypothetical protein
MKSGKKNNSGKTEKAKGQKSSDNDKDPILVPGTSADVNKNDLEALGPKDLSMDMGDDEDLKHRLYPVDFAGKDLDVPGSEMDDEQEQTGSEDEENNSYSIGGDDHDKLEETNNI